MQQYTLEKSKLFPLFAWTLTIGFALFVGTLTLQLRQAIQELEVITQNVATHVTPIPDSSL